MTRLFSPQAALKENIENIRNDIKRLNYLVTGLYIAGAVALGYIVNLLNTIIGKL